MQLPHSQLWYQVHQGLARWQLMRLLVCSICCASRSAAKSGWPYILIQQTMHMTHCPRLLPVEQRKHICAANAQCVRESHGKLAHAWDHRLTCDALIHVTLVIVCCIYWSALCIVAECATTCAGCRMNGTGSADLTPPGRHPRPATPPPPAAAPAQVSQMQVACVRLSIC